MARRILERLAMHLEYEVDARLLDLKLVKMKMRMAQIDFFAVEGWVASVVEELPLHRV
jgi:hypothetical protein